MLNARQLLSVYDWENKRETVRPFWWNCNFNPSSWLDRSVLVVPIIILLIWVGQKDTVQTNVYQRMYTKCFFLVFLGLSCFMKHKIYYRVIRLASLFKIVHHWIKLMYFSKDQCDYLYLWCKLPKSFDISRAVVVEAYFTCMKILTWLTWNIFDCVAHVVIPNLKTAHKISSCS